MQIIDEVIADHADRGGNILDVLGSLLSGDDHVADLRGRIVLRLRSLRKTQRGEPARRKKTQATRR